jgi:iron(II)-dependent oxidoreductase
MIAPTILSQLCHLYEMQNDLLQSQHQEICAKRHHPKLASLNWYYGRGVYLELLWLREKLCGDDELSQRVGHLFIPGAIDLEEQCSLLPPTDHLIRWGTEIRDEHIRRLATPGALKEHSSMDHERLSWFLLQEQSKLYENMLMVLYQYQQQQKTPYLCQHPLRSTPPGWETKEIAQGHYRIGARNHSNAYDNELPPQAVEMSSYRIALSTITNAQYLSFIESEGYQKEHYWSDEGWQWQMNHPAHHPEYWRKDDQGNWYELALNGPTHLPPDNPVTGINLYEAQAFASWTASQDKRYSGAVLQHEYQWEIAARSGVLKNTGRAWEWCSNTLHPYPEFQPFPDTSLSENTFSGRFYTLKGGSLHTQKVLRRASFRHWSSPSDHHLICTARLVFPARFQWD